MRQPRKTKVNMDAARAASADKGGMASTAERLIAQRMERERLEEVAIENEKEYKSALNGMAASRNGELFLKTLIKATGIFKDPQVLNPAGLIEDKGMRKVYLRLIRPYLDPSIRAKIEE